MVENKTPVEKTTNNLDVTQPSAETMRTQVKRLETLQKLAMSLGTTLELKSLLPNLISEIGALVDHRKILVLVSTEDAAGLRYGAASFKLPEKLDRSTLADAVFTTYNGEKDPVIGPWLRGEMTDVKTAEVADDSQVKSLVVMFELGDFFSLPLLLNERLVGVIVIEPEKPESVSDDHRALFRMIAVTLAIAVDNARRYSKTVAELESTVFEMNILQQIDRELNDTIALDIVFRMTLDWALRFTNAHAALLALYDEDEDQLRIITHYGYELDATKLQTMRAGQNGGITLRVARTGRTEATPDVSLDSDYIMVEANTRSQMSVPVIREDRVIAVITLESKKLNGFEEKHVEFVQKLATRAAVAIDNARLFTETEREKEKLSHILSSIGDVVIVIGLDDNVILINESAISALRLYSDKEYVRQPVTTVLEHTPLMDVYRRAKILDETNVEEVDLPNARTYHCKISPHEGIGWIIVLQDITPFKEMDKLKSELIATVSHDLKQPLSVMTGYLDLLEMKNKFDEQSSNFVNMIDRSIRNMRQLIDDLLDLAKIESGIELKLGPVQVANVINECLEAVKPAAENKSMTITTDIPPNLPPVRGEQARLRQIFENLISNAVKYTPPEGKVHIFAESRGLTIRVSIKDNGLGIGPEDQAHIFDRFYRVRRPETDSIDGTGLGLAIVKTLVEAHHGKIGLESRLGEGSTFYVTLPTE